MSDTASKITRLRAALAASEARAEAAESELAQARAVVSTSEAMIEELEAAATEDEIAAGKATTTTVAGFERRRPARKPFPDHLPRERVVIEAPTACFCCGSDRIVKMGEDITETLEVSPRQWKVIQTVREKFTCRACEKISQPPAPFHPTPCGWAGPNLLAMILFEKFGQHQPLTDRPSTMKRKVSISASRRWPTRSGPAPRLWHRSTP